MHYRQLQTPDLLIYKDDIYNCYQSNHLILDNQNPIDISSPEGTMEFIEGFVEAQDSCVLGIFDSKELFLYGLVIFDNIRMGVSTSAEVHIVNDKAIFGKKLKGLYEQILKETIFDVIYAQIPSIATHVASLCKRLGFKKTGYIPKVLPYTNSLGEEKMYDIQIWTYGG